MLWELLGFGFTVLGDHNHVVGVLRFRVQGLGTHVYAIGEFPTCPQAAEMVVFQNRAGLNTDPKSTMVHIMGNPRMVPVSLGPETLHPK